MTLQPAQPVTALVQFAQPTFPLRLTAVPAGLLFEDPNSEADRKPRLVVFREDTFDPQRPENLMDPGPTTSPEIDGRRALLVRGRESVEAQVELPDGSAVVPDGPSDLITDEQLLRMAAGVSLTRD